MHCASASLGAKGCIQQPAPGHWAWRGANPCALSQVRAAPWRLCAGVAATSAAMFQHASTRVASSMSWREPPGLWCGPAVSTPTIVVVLGWGSVGSGETLGRVDRISGGNRLHSLSVT
eukprot:scaffold108571_cov48-Phaeocystis_antarctica.AAC.1